MNRKITNPELDMSLSCQPPNLLINFYYIPTSNGTDLTYLFIPFNVKNNTSTSYNGGDIKTKIITTKYGSMIFINASVPYQSNYQDVKVNFDFYIEETFFDLSRGRMRIILPFNSPLLILGNESIRKILPSGLSIIACKSSVSLSFPLNFIITLTYPSAKIIPISWPSVSGSIQGLRWEFDYYPDSIIVYCEDPKAVTRYESMLRFSMLFLGIGIPMIVASFIEIMKTDISKPKRQPEPKHEEAEEQRPR
jgi:hypothetical protein